MLMGTISVMPIDVPIANRPLFPDCIVDMKYMHPCAMVRLGLMCILKSRECATLQVLSPLSVLWYLLCCDTYSDCFLKIIYTYIYIFKNFICVRNLSYIHSSVQTQTFKLEAAFINNII